MKQKVYIGKDRDMHRDMPIYRYRYGKMAIVFGYSFWQKMAIVFTGNKEE